MGKLHVRSIEYSLPYDLYKRSYVNDKNESLTNESSLTRDTSTGFIRCFSYRRQFISAGSFAGLSFLSLYLSGKIQAFDHRGHVAKLCIVFLPLLVASLVGISRVDDYWHHWQDVFAGGLLGPCCYEPWFRLATLQNVLFLRVNLL